MKTIALKILLVISSAAALGAPLAAHAEGGKVDIKIEGMHCESCVRSVREALAKLPNVEPGSVQVVLKENRATITVKEGKDVPRSEIEAAVKKAGYKVTPASASKS